VASNGIGVVRGGSDTASGGSGVARGGSGAARGGSSVARGGSGAASGGSGVASGGGGVLSGGGGAASGGSGAASGRSGVASGGSGMADIAACCCVCCNMCVVARCTGPNLAGLACGATEVRFALLIPTPRAHDSRNRAQLQGREACGPVPHKAKRSPACLCMLFVLPAAMCTRCISLEADLRLGFWL
jgi:hypothetical protein